MYYHAGWSMMINFFVPPLALVCCVALVHSSTRVEPVTAFAMRLYFNPASQQFPLKKVCLHSQKKETLYEGKQM